jgi:hypothetical protein
LQSKGEMLRGLPHSNELGRWFRHSWSSSMASSSTCTSYAGSSCETFTAASSFAATDSLCDPVMMHRCKWLCKWCSKWNGTWWSWWYAIIWTCLTRFDRVGVILFYQVVNIIQKPVPQAHVIYYILFYS